MSTTLLFEISGWVGISLNLITHSKWSSVTKKSFKDLIATGRRLTETASQGFSSERWSCFLSHLAAGQECSQWFDIRQWVSKLNLFCSPVCISIVHRTKGLPFRSNLSLPLWIPPPPHCPRQWSHFHPSRSSVTGGYLLRSIWAHMNATLYWNVLLIYNTTQVLKKQKHWNCVKNIIWLPG